MPTPHLGIARSELLLILQPGLPVALMHRSRNWGDPCPFGYESKEALMFGDQWMDVGTRFELGVNRYECVGRGQDESVIARRLDDGVLVELHLDRLEDQRYTLNAGAEAA